MRPPSGRVLVLNRSYEPFSTMSVPQVMRKLSKTDSVLFVERWAEDRTIKTSKGEYPVPSVVRLNYYLDIRNKREKSGAKRFSIYRRDKFHCQYCNIKVGQSHPQLKDEAGHSRKMTVEDLTLDHILPKSRGGRNTPDNLVTCCMPCNHRKGNRTPAEARMPLLTPQSLLRVRLDTIQMSNYIEFHPEWKKYLFLADDSEGDLRFQATG